jgi:hypothetical protein
MRHYSLWAVAVLVAAVVIGCGPGKHLPDDIPDPKGPEQTEPQIKVPAVSDPAAKEIVERAIKAHTQGNPSLLAKGKLSRSTANGTIKLAVGPQQEVAPVPTQRAFVARWPDEIKYTLAYKTRPFGTVTLILRGRLTWELLNDQPRANVNPEKAEQLMRTDGLAQHWLPLLFPLVEPKAVVFEPRKGVGDPPVDTVRFAYPDRPPYALAFDPKSGYLTRVDYHLTDLTGLVFTEWMFAEHKPFGGVMLPTKLTSARTTDRPRVREVVQEWTVESWEFPEKIDDKEFEPPR